MRRTVRIHPRGPIVLIDEPDATVIASTGVHEFPQVCEPRRRDVGEPVTEQHEVVGPVGQPVEQIRLDIDDLRVRDSRAG